MTTDPRVQRSKEAVLRETHRLLAESGIGGVSIDEVARRSGVAKTTIYRHWPSRSALLLEACATMGDPLEAPDTGSLRGDFTALATELAEHLRSERWAAVVPSIVDAAERDPELAGLYTRLHAAMMAPFLAAAERAKKRGELPRGARPADVVATLVGPLFYRRWFSREPLDSAFLKAVVTAAVGPAVTRR
jgi:AcrR family transcriptional regulator